jgi:hypothetical protein
VSRKENLLFVIVVLVFALVAAVAGQKAPTHKVQYKKALGENNVKQLLLLMDTDKNGKFSEKEYMSLWRPSLTAWTRTRAASWTPKS